MSGTTRSTHTTDALDSAPAQDPATIRRVVLASSMGTAIEWFDFALYGAASALVFGPLFFPSRSDLASTLAAFATFAVAFFMRPVGGLIAAHIGDRYGRKPVLIATVVVMGVATVLVGLLPTYATIGVWAPVLLVGTRMLQGLGAGAEFAGAVTTMSEYTPQNRRGYYTSWAQAAVGLAIASANGLFAILALSVSKETLQAGAWRIPFLASAVIFVVAIFIRRRIEETPAFREASKNAGSKPKTKRIPLVTALRESPRELIAGILCGSGLNVFGYMVNTYSISYVTKTLGLPALLGTVAVVCAAGSSFFTAPLFGRLADRIGYRKVFAGGAILALVYLVPMFLLIDTKNSAVVVIALTFAYGVCQSAMLGSQSVFLAELFPTRYRFTGIAAAREINVMVLGGTTPFIATALVASAGGAPWYLVVFAACALLVTILSVTLSRHRGLNTVE